MGRFPRSQTLPVLVPKSTTFSHFVQVQRPQEINEKNSKKLFFGYLLPVQMPYYWT
jgi:hypothetical protein